MIVGTCDKCMREVKKPKILKWYDKADEEWITNHFCRRCFKEELEYCKEHNIPLHGVIVKEKVIFT